MLNLAAMTMYVLISVAPPQLIVGGPYLRLSDCGRALSIIGKVEGTAVRKQYKCIPMRFNRKGERT